MPPARFVTDSSLDFLARRLRFLGYDVTTLRGARLEEVFDVARREDRIVLTLSRRHPRAFAGVRAVVVPRAQPEQALREIRSGYEPAGPPLTRCALCNVALQRRQPLEAMGEVPGRVLRRVRWVDFCPSCGKWYWEGSHVARLRRWFEIALGDSPRA